MKDSHWANVFVSYYARTMESKRKGPTNKKEHGNFMEPEMLHVNNLIIHGYLVHVNTKGCRV